MNQADLFYPVKPGYRRLGTSKAAAEKVAPRALTIRDQMLALFKAEALTADQCAERLGKSVLTCRPRASELLAMGKIYDTGRTHANKDSGIQAVIWRAK